MKSQRDKRIIITEGNFDTEFLHKVLPVDIIKESTFIIGQGYSSLISKAKSISISSNIDIFLIMDSDTTNEFEINEKHQNIQSIFSMLGKEKQIKTFFFVPQLEVVFFQNENFINKYFNDINFNSIISINELIKTKFNSRFDLLKTIDSEILLNFQTKTDVKDLIKLLEK
ncbi:hypothetical protein D3C87_937480 [compost metagenome]